MKNIIMAVVLVLALGLLSCSNAVPAEKSMVAVWASGNQTDTQEEPLAYGLVVGDGTQILTVLDFNTDIPRDLFVGVPGQARYPVIIQATDISDSVALLKMQKNVFPPAAIAKSDEDTSGKVVIIHGWTHGNLEKMDRSEIVFIFKGAPGQMKNEIGPYNDNPGALITTKSGQIIGLLGVYRASADPTAVRLGPVGGTYPMVDIQDALLILSRTTSQSSYWPGVKVHTDNTKTIAVKTGDEFSIKFTVTGDSLPIIRENHDSEVLKLMDSRVLSGETFDNPIIAWFLFMPSKTGKTQITI